MGLATVVHRFSDFPLAPPRELLKPADGVEAIVTVMIILSTFLLDLAIEVPVLQTHLYIYYGLSRST